MKASAPLWISTECSPRLASRLLLVCLWLLMSSCASIAQQAYAESSGCWWDPCVFDVSLMLLRLDQETLCAPFGIFTQKLIFCCAWFACRLGSLSLFALGSAPVSQSPFADSRVEDPCLAIRSSRVAASLFPIAWHLLDPAVKLLSFVLLLLLISIGVHLSAWLSYASSWHQ